MTLRESWVGMEKNSVLMTMREEPDLACYTGCLLVAVARSVVQAMDCLFGEIGKDKHLVAGE
jgi:hypothetical protein